MHTIYYLLIVVIYFLLLWREEMAIQLFSVAHMANAVNLVTGCDDSNPFTINNSSFCWNWHIENQPWKETQIRIIMRDVIYIYILLQCLERYCIRDTIKKNAGAEIAIRLSTARHLPRFPTKFMICGMFKTARKLL